jgi:hypothetical protein
MGPSFAGNLGCAKPGIIRLIFCHPLGLITDHFLVFPALGRGGRPCATEGGGLGLSKLRLRLVLLHPSASRLQRVLGLPPLYPGCACAVCILPPAGLITRPLISTMYTQQYIHIELRHDPTPSLGSSSAVLNTTRLVPLLFIQYGPARAIDFSFTS